MSLSVIKYIADESIFFVFQLHCSWQHVVGDTGRTFVGDLTNKIAPIDRQQTIYQTFSGARLCKDNPQRGNYKNVLAKTVHISLPTLIYLCRLV